MGINFYVVFLLYGLNIFLVKCEENSTVAESKISGELYDIEGFVFAPEYISTTKKQAWLLDTKVYIKGGEHIGFLREDGSFVIEKLPSGSYVVEVISGNYVYEPVRVDINSKGKYRARKVNYLQNSQIATLPYPLKLVPLGFARYFQPREQWRITDLLLNPMVLMMVLPLLCIMVLPRLINDSETKKDMEQFQSLAKYDMPEMSEMITSFFGGGSGDKQNLRGNKPNKKAIKSS